MADVNCDFDALAEVFKALGHPVRLRILLRTISGDCCVGKLQDELDRSQPNISQHLAVLRAAGLIVPVRVGKKVCYRPADDLLVEIISLGTSALGRIKSA